MTAYEVFRFAHVAIGALALVTFWLAAFARKGSPLHVGAGRVYLVVMAGVLVTAVPLVAQRFMMGQWVFGMFFVLLLSLVATALSGGYTAIRHKRDWRRYVGSGYRMLMVSNLAVGAVVLTIGAWQSRWILLAFGAFGVKLARDMLRFARQEPAPNWWFVQHYQAMIGNGIATHVAFLLIGLPRLLPDADARLLGYVGWLAPLAIGIGLQYMLDRKYVKKAVSKRVVAA